MRADHCHLRNAKCVTIEICHSPPPLALALGADYPGGELRIIEWLAVAD
jgi:hypothetical protein